jgi:peptidoglycan/xylan/chitin deacetylase (PgdA/CDA1 family)
VGGAGGARVDAAAGQTGGDAGMTDASGATPDVIATTSTFRVDSVATWRGNATGAYSLIHDDICDPSVASAITIADPELILRGLHGGFGVIVSRCARNNGWENVKTLLAHGQDVFNHSWNHPCMTNDDMLAEACDPAAPRSVDFVQEIDRSNTTLRTMLGIPIEFFIFPYDVCDPAAIALLKQLGYLGARCGSRNTNVANFADGFRVNFDVWGPAYSVYLKDPTCAGVVEFTTAPAMAPAACRAAVLKDYVDDTITRKAWGVREFHGFDGDPGSFEPLPPAEYKAHLDYLASKVMTNELWVDGPTPVIRYRFARQFCAPLPTVSGAMLKFPAPSADCQRYATALSYIVSTTDGSDPAVLHIQQGSTVVPARKLARGSFAVDANPTRGDAVLAQ